MAILNHMAFKRALPIIMGLGLGAFVAGTADATTVLRASHQFPAGKGDVRDEMVQIIAREVKAANVGLEIQVYPGASLFKPKEQWNAMVKGQLDMSAFALDYASGKHPEFGATLMPGLVGNHDRAARLNKSPFMADIRKIIEDDGVIVLADAWLAGAFGSKKNCILEPKDVQGLKVRSAGPSFAEMWAAAGASIASMPSNEVYNALQSGVIDATDTSAGSLKSFRLYEQLSCLTAPGENALWFMYEPVLMSKKSYDRLNDAQKKALRAAAAKSEAYFDKATRTIDDQMVEAFKKAGVKIVTMNAAQYAEWQAVAKKSSYKTFIEQVPGGKKLLDEALAVK